METTRIVFFGASGLGERTLAEWPDRLGPVSHFVDNDRRTWGQVRGGLPVRSPETLRTEDPDRLFVVVTSVHYDQIAAQLEAFGLVEGEDFASPQQALNHWALSAGAGQEPGAGSTLTALVVPVSWFGLDYRALRDACAERGARCVFAPPARKDRRVELSLTPADYRDRRRGGVPIFAACVYDICVSLGVTIERLDAANPRHWAAITEQMERCAAAIDAAGRVLDRSAADVVVIPQGHTTVAAVHRYLAILRGLRVVALENSLNATKLVWDDLAGVAVNKIQARNHYWRWADLVDPAAADAHVRWYLSSIKTLKQAQHQSPSSEWAGRRRAGRTVLYLANVLTDASVMFNSRVGSQVDAIAATAEWALDHACTFILKLHPRERPGHAPLYEGLTLNALRENRRLWDRLSASGDVVIDADNAYDTYALIRDSDVCVTICSQAGLEALMMGKETVLLGDAYYGGLGFTHEVHGLSQLGPALDQALQPAGRRRDPGAVAKFFYVLDRLYCIDKSESGVAGLLCPSSRRAGASRRDEAA
jgi:hypothetical protein